MKTLIDKDSGLPMMGRRFARIVEECLYRLDRGENLPDVLADFPAEAEQLKPLLLVAMASRSITVPLPSQTAQRLGKNHMLSAMDSVGLQSGSKAVPLPQRARQWSTRLVNNLRAQYLIRPAPSYRLAIIALVVIFGSGLFALSASASPSDLLSAFAADFQGVMEIFDGGDSEGSQNYFKLFTIFSENYSLFPGKQAAKVAFQLDFSDDSDHQAITKNIARSAQSGPTNNGNDPGGGDPDPQGPPDVLPPNPPGQDPDREDHYPPSPFPGNAANVVEEVVSDTAKEKDPLWDQLPFNVVDQMLSEDSGDQEDADPPAADEEEKRGSRPWFVSWLLGEKDNDDGDGHCDDSGDICDDVDDDNDDNDDYEEEEEEQEEDED